MLRRHVFRTLPGSYWARHLSITPVAMPALSPTMEQGKITEWVTKIGDKISGGETWCKIETDKAVASFDNVAEEGYVARFLYDAPTDSLKVGTPVLLLVDEKEGINSAEVKNWSGSGSTPTAPAAVQPPSAASGTATPVVMETAASTTSSSSSAGGRIFASPLAKVTAQSLGVDLATVRGTGGDIGRITKQDVVEASKSPKAAAAAAAAPPPAADVKKPATASAPKPSATAGASPVGGSAYEDIPVTSMRATIAKRLTQSKNVEVPHYYLMHECRAENLLETIKHLNAKGAGKFKISVNDYIIKAVARANLLVPACNSSWMGDFIRQYKGVDVSVAVATPTGLITPIVRNAHIKGLGEISMETKALAQKARDGTLQLNEFVGGTVSVSNLGASGIPAFTAIINPPQAMILAVGSMQYKPKVVKDEETGKYRVNGEAEPVIACTASFDHRVVDGAVGAEWFKHFKDAMENPLSLLL